MGNQYKAGISSRPPTLLVEKWFCHACCTPVAPCRIQITYEPTPFPHVEEKSRFVNRPCLADESRFPEWKKDT
jgi:hypothetical protein